MDEDEVLDLLMERVRYWTDDEEIIALFEEMYSNAIYNGAMDGMELDVNAIVDNDYVLLVWSSFKRRRRL